MAYHINEELSDLIFEVLEGNSLVIKIKGGSGGSGTPGGGGGSNIYIIKKGELTPPTDKNVFSALRTLEEINSLDKDSEKKYIRKDMEDSTPFLLTLLKGAVFGEYIEGLRGAKCDESGRITSDQLISHLFTSGLLGTGFCVKRDPVTGRSYVETDDLLVRRRAMFAVLEILKSRYIGGDIIQGPGGGKCESVKEYPTYYRCYIKTDDGSKEVENTFALDDLVRVQDFNIKPGVHENVSNQYYWRRCIAVGDNYIDLSKTDCDVGSTAPQPGDEMATMGNVTNPDRQAATVYGVYGDDAPYIKQYLGINSYNLTGKEKTVVSPKGNKFSGRFYFESGQDIENAFTDLMNKYQENLNFVQAISSELDAVKNQLDGNITAWFEDPVPSLYNKPYIDWKDDKERDTHLKDLYYDAKGNVYRFEKRNGVYSWEVIKDEQLAKALADAKKAQDTADHKRRVFIKQPTFEEAYDKGDLWVNAVYKDDTHNYDDDLLRCIYPKEANSPFSITHWSKAAKYTDDTVANEAKQRLEEWAKDGYISPTEKRELKDEIKRIDADKSYVEKTVATYQLAVPQAYYDAHAAYRNLLTELTASTPENIKIPDDIYYPNRNFAWVQKNYYDLRAAAFNAVNDKTKATFVATDKKIEGIVKNVTNIEGVVSDHESRIMQTEDAIQAQVAVNKEVGDKLKEHTNSLLELTPEKITQKVQSEISETNLGGMNHALNTSKELRYDINFRAGAMGYQTSGFRSGDTITVSFEIDWNLTENGNSQIYRMLQFDGTYAYMNFYNFPEIDNGAGWKRIKRKLKLTKQFDTGNPITENLVSRPYLRCDDNQTAYQNGGYIHVRKFKVELGSTASDWSASPDDMGAEVKKNSEALLELTPEKISLKVREETDNLRLGSINLLLNSRLASLDGWSVNQTPEVVELNGVRCIKCNSLSEGVYIYSDRLSRIKGKVVCSVDVFAEQDAQIRLGFKDVYPELINVTEKGRWVRVYQRIEVNNTRQPIICYLNQNNKTVYFKNIKLEEGDIASGWSPAPEDIERINRNLLYNSDFASEKMIWYSGRGGVVTSRDGNSLKAVFNGDGAVGADIVCAITSGIIKANSDYVFSGYVKTDIPNEMVGRVGYGASANSVKTTTDYQYFCINIKSGTQQGGTFHPYIKKKGTLWLKDIKLEEGTQATAWSPAPEDYLANKKKLLEAGIDIDSQTVTVTADKFLVRTTTGKPGLKVFEDVNGIPVLQAQYVSTYSIAAKRGTIGQFSIDDNGLYNDDENPTAYIRILKSKGDKRGFVVNQGPQMVQITTSADTALYIEALNAYSKGLQIVASNTPQTKAIDSVGNVLLKARTGEEIRIEGMHINAMRTSSFGTNIDFYVVPSVQFFTLPLASTAVGKIVLLKFMGNTTLRSKSPIYRQDNANYVSKGGDGYYWDTFNGRSLIVVSDGSSWFIFGGYFYR